MATYSEKDITILVVEDNVTSREVLSRLFRLCGYSAIEATDGEHALNLISIQMPDLIVTDINMPRMDGVEMIRRLRQNGDTAKTPIVAVTAWGKEAAKEAMAAGANAFFEKPFDFDKFLSIIEDLLSRFLPKSEQLNRKPEPNLILPIEKTITVVNQRIIDTFRNNPEALRTIDPFVFEGVIADLFCEEGYEIVLTPPRADGGKDIYVYKTDPLTKVMFLVECKRYVPPTKVDVAVARQLYGVIQQERASGGVIVTTSYFTKPAKEFAAKVPHQLFLRDFDYLVQWLRKAK